MRQNYVHRHGEYSPNNIIDPIRVAEVNPKRSWLMIQNIGAAGGKIAISLGDSSHVCAVLPNQYDAFIIDKNNPWDGDVFVDADIFAANLVYVMEVSEV